MPTPTPVREVISESFVQINDRDFVDSKDTYTIRANVDVRSSGADPVAEGLANGVTVAVFESGAAPETYVEVNTFNFTAFGPKQCKPLAGGLSLYCKDAKSQSYFLLRGSKASPGLFRIETVVRRLDFIPGKPFVVPLAGEVAIGQLDWAVLTTLELCEVTQNGERTTCRLKR